MYYIQNPDRNISSILQGSFNPKNGDICIYKDITEQDFAEYLGILAHELAHRFDYSCSESDDYWSTENWKSAIAQDGISVSNYGDTNEHEDFAEFVKLYSEVYVGMGTTSFEELKQKYSNRYNALQELIKQRRK